MSSLLCREKITLNEEEDVPPTGLEDRRRPSLEICMQVSLLCASILVLGFGLAMTGMGLWAYETQKEYITIADNDPQLTRLPFTMMVTGGFVAVLGLLGVSGSIFSRGITGQTLLGVFSFVLVLVIVSEMGAGAAAINLKYHFESVFINSTARSQARYTINSTTTREIWDSFQKKHSCCGAEGYVGNLPPYYHVFMNDSVPTSCCINQDDEDACKTYAMNATLHKDQIQNAGCPYTVMDILTRNLLIISGTAITIGAVQILAVTLAAIVAYMSSRKDDKGRYSYNRLHQQEEKAKPSSILT